MKVKSTKKKVSSLRNYRTSEERNPQELISRTYEKAKSSRNSAYSSLPPEQQKRVDAIIFHERDSKSVFNAIIASLLKKSVSPKRDIRYHDTRHWKKGYSLSSFGMKNVVRFLHDKGFSGAVNGTYSYLTNFLTDSTWFGKSYQGTAQSKEIKEMFLEVIDDVRCKGVDPRAYLQAIFERDLITRQEKKIVPMKRHCSLTSDDVMEILDEHLSSDFTKGHTLSEKGKSKLPVIATWCLYDCLCKRPSYLHGMKIEHLRSHYDTDRKSNDVGDITIRDNKGNIYECVDVKDTPPTGLMFVEAYEKLRAAGGAGLKYIMLSTEPPSSEDSVDISWQEKDIRKEYHCVARCEDFMSYMSFRMDDLASPERFLAGYYRMCMEDREIPQSCKDSLSNIMDRKRLLDHGKFSAEKYRDHSASRDVSGGMSLSLSF